MCEPYVHVDVGVVSQIVDPPLLLHLLIEAWASLLVCTGQVVVVIENLDEINSNFSKIDCKKLIPCNCDECRGRDFPEFYEYSKLQRRKNLFSFSNF